MTRGALRRHRADAPRAPRDTDAEVVLDGVCLRVEAGEVVSLLGESGGGKTTLLRVVDRLVEPDAGRVEVLGRPVAAWEVSALRRSAALVSQQAVLLADGTAREELTLPRAWARREVDDAACRRALGRVSLGELDLDAPARELSGGQRERLALARALLLEPPVLLLDEPTGSLDVRTARAVLGGLTSWAEERGATLVCATHRPDELTALGGRAGVLLEGRLHGPFAAAEVAAGDVADAAVADFLGALPASSGDASGEGP